MRSPHRGYICQATVTVPPDHIPETAAEPAYPTAISAMERVGNASVAIAAYSAFLERWPDNVAASTFDAAVGETHAFILNRMGNTR